MTRYPQSEALHLARVAIASPQGRDAAEMAGHVMLLLWHGTRADESNARAFARTMPYRADLAMWMDFALPPDDAPFATIPPQVTPRNMIEATGYGVVFVAVAWLLIAAALAL
jgi:hypothetical protein